MFTGRYQGVPGQGELTQPSTAESMTATFKADYMTPFLLIPGMEKQKRQELYDRVNSLRAVASGRGQIDSGGQYWGNQVAGMAGAILNPLSLLTGEAAGAAVGGASRIGLGRVASFTGKFLPSEGAAFVTKPLHEIIGEAAPNFATKESVASLSQKAVSGFAQGTGFALPSEVANTYNPNTDSFNWQQGIKASFFDGGVGLALMSAPYLGGILWGKYFGAAADHAKMPLPGETPEFSATHVDEAVAGGKLTPDEGQWFKDYFFKGDTNENLSKRATDMLIKGGHDADAATNQVMFKMLHPNDVDNLQQAVADKLAATHIPEDVKPMLQGYISRNSVDNMRDAPVGTVDGLQGVVNFVRRRLAKAPDEMVDFHKIMRRLLPENLKENNPFTQAKLYRAIREEGRTGLHIPEQVEKRLNQEAKINRLKQQMGDWQKEMNKTGKARYQKMIDKNAAKIEELSGKVEPLLSHADEIKHLREKLLPGGKVAENFKATREHGRLLDLTRVRNDARRLMHEVNLKHEYEMHEAYATVLDTISKTMKSEFGRLANPEDVNNYMMERIQGRVPEFKNLEIKDVKEDVKVDKAKIDEARKLTKTPEGRDEAVKTFDEEIKKTEAKEVVDEYSEVKSQYEEFKDNPNVFSSLVKCVLGAMNG